MEASSKGSRIGKKSEVGGGLIVKARPVTLDLTRAAAKVDASCQTDAVPSMSNRRVSSGSECDRRHNVLNRIFSSLPEWYWTGHMVVPAKVGPPPKVNIRKVNSAMRNSVSAMDGALSAVSKSQPVRRMTSSLSDMQESLSKFKGDLVTSSNRRRDRGEEANPREAPPLPAPARPLRAAERRDLDKPRPPGVRRGSILEQVEARRAPYLSRNAIKKQVMQQFHQSISKFSIDDGPGPTSPNNTVTTTVDASVGDLRGSIRRRNRPPMRIQRSFTVDSFALGTVGGGKKKEGGGGSPKRRKSLRFTSKIVSLGLLPGMETEKEKRAKRLRKMWDETYVGMCNRAAVLNHVIDKADKEEVSVKPISSAAAGTDAKTKPDEEDKGPLDTLGKKEKRLFLGLSEQFYHVDDDEDPTSAESSGDEQDNAVEKGERRDTIPRAIKASVQEIDFTEEVSLTHSHLASPKLRLNLRTRSVDYSAADLFPPPPPPPPGGGFVRRTRTTASTVRQSRRSIVDDSSPSHIPRLSKSASIESGAVDYLHLDPKQGGGKDHQQQDDSSNRSSFPSPEVNEAVLSNVVRMFKSQLSKKSTYVDASTQITLPPLFHCSPRSESPDSRPVERQIEARSGSEDGLGSMVRCLQFAKTHIANREYSYHIKVCGICAILFFSFNYAAQTLSHTLWAGTNSGQILVFLLTLPNAEKRQSGEKATAVLAKEIQLKHRAPVIDIRVLDAGGSPVDEGEEEEAPAPHRVLIASEEQFKTFLLPMLKPSGKYKLTAHEGSRIRRLGYTTFVSKSDRSHSENCFVCLTNQGDLCIHSLPDLRRQVLTNCVRKEDVIAISSLVLTRAGEAFYMCSSSELQRVSVSAARVLRPSGVLALPPGARPDPPPPPPPKRQEQPAAAAAPSSSPQPTLTVTAPEEENEKNEKKQEATTKTAAASPSTAAVTATAGTAAVAAARASPGDQHNDTTVSEISADITLDSVKDHTQAGLQSTASLASASSQRVTSSTTVSSSAAVATNGDGERQQQSSTTTTRTTTSQSSSMTVVKSSQETSVNGSGDAAEGEKQQTTVII